jgi:hypothetical protein
MNKKNGIIKPIFMIGTGRCGSTIIFEALAVHETLAWFSNYNKLLPWFDIVSIAPRIYDVPLLRRMKSGEKEQYSQGKTLLNKFKPQPFESYTKWNVLCGRKFAKSFLKDVTATAEEKTNVIKAVSKAVKLQNKSRFLAKLTGPPRITYLNSIFPDAQFINVTRHPYAVICSLLEVDYWTDESGQKKPYWEGGLQDNWQKEWARYGRNRLSLTAMQVRAILRATEQEKTQLCEGRYMDVAYEEFLKAPQDVIAEIQKFCDLPVSKAVRNFVNAHSYTNQNKKYFDKLTDEEKQCIDDILNKAK